MRRLAKSCVGQRFGKLVGIKAVSNTKYLFRCDCGREEIREGRFLRYHTKLKSVPQCAECCKKIRSENGKSRRADGISADYPLLYDVHRQMLRRCYDPLCKDYPAYGSRGIRVCRLWHNKLEFINWALANGYKKGLSIERKNINKGYGANNCTWIPHRLQYRNSRNTTIINYKGADYTVRELAIKFDLSYNTLRGRLFHLRWPLEKALKTPAFHGRNQFSE